MADLISPIIDTLSCLCRYCSKWVDSIRKLADNLESLRNASNDLNSRYLDVEMRVKNAEQDPNQELTVKNEVRRWMSKVQDLQNEVQAILGEGNLQIQARCFGGRCPKNCRASYKLSRSVTQKLSDVNDLMSKHFEAVAEKLDFFTQKKTKKEKLDFDRFKKLPMDKAVGVESTFEVKKLPMDKAVGVESTFEELRSYFQNNQVGTIGLYGMGGVGKTTLLKKFNNDFLSTITNHVVIWVVASKDADPGKIQDDIRKKLHVQDDIWNNESVDDRPVFLYNILNEKKFVLLLDDVWERIDLLKLGVPSPNDRECKIIFTTRLKEVCGRMDAQRCIKVKCLEPDKAFELFKEKAGGTILEDLSDLAKQVVDECQGLPLALCTVGRAMANKVTPTEWRRTIEILRNYPSKVQGIVEDVYYLLEFSYDRLPNDVYKSCFLYCALFREDYNILKEELIMLWIAEGFLTELNIHEARKEGEDIISSLLYACLLENGEKENTIKMHDVIRDMALWVACDHGKKTRFFVRDCSKTNGLDVYNHEKWEEVEMLSLWGSGRMITNLSQKPHCPNLVTMLIRDTSVQVFPTELFVRPTTIRVLDLSSNRGIRDVPSAIGDLVDLEHMNLSYTGVTKLPEELKNLKKLRFLLLDGLNVEFPRELVSSLSSLQAFSMKRGRVPYDDALLDELEGLDHLQYLRFSVCSISCLQKIQSSSKLKRCMSELFVQVNLQQNDFLSSVGKMEHLEELQVESKREMDDYEARIQWSSIWEHEHIISLRKLILNGCQNIRDLNWLIQAPNLEFVELVSCSSLVEVISEDVGIAEIDRNVFSSLTHLVLLYLNNLKAICRIPLRFPCLKEIQVLGCHKLKKLPFNSQSLLKNLQCFSGGPKSWMDKLQWEDEATKHLLSSKFQRV